MACAGNTLVTAMRVIDAGSRPARAAAAAMRCRTAAILSRRPSWTLGCKYLLSHAGFSAQPLLEPPEGVFLHLGVELVRHVVELRLEPLGAVQVGVDGADLVRGRLHPGAREEAVAGAVLHENRGVRRGQRGNVGMVQGSVHAEGVEQPLVHGIG